MFVPGGSSFSWEENVDEVLNFCFWLRRQGDLDEAQLSARIHEWAAPHSREARGRKYPGSKEYRARLRRARGHPRWKEYLPIGRAWTRTENERLSAEMEPWASHVEHARSHFREMEAIGVPLHAEWVMAAFGERWLVPPNLAVMGVEGSDWEGRQAAVLAAARSIAATGA